MPTTTTNYGWSKPDVGASTDAWGGLLNADLDGIDSTVKSVSNVANAALPSSTAATTYVAKAGDTMTGGLNINVATAVNSLVIAPTATVGANIILNKASGSAANIWAMQASLNRWQFALGNATVEGAGNAGSDFVLNAYDNAGSLLGTPLMIERKTGYATIGGNGATAPAASGAAAGHSTLRVNKAGSGNIGQIVGLNNGTTRWSIALGDSTAESSNAGSNFTINAFNDAGSPATVPTPLTISRSTSVASFSVAIVNGPSDRTLKENIAPLEGALDKVKALQGVTFNMIATPDKREIGLIAQDVEPVVPEIVQNFQTHDAEGKAAETKLALDYPKLTALLIEAVKTLSARIEALEAARG